VPERGWKAVGMPQLAPPDNSAAERWHVCTGNDGESLICLVSLLKGKGAISR